MLYNTNNVPIEASHITAVAEIGTDKVYIIRFPMFHLVKHRHQLIIEPKLPDKVFKKYTEAKKTEPTSTFGLTADENIDIATFVAENKPFKATIN
ncbi:uncharacterized protein KY384_006678 [Bacidia gigantensis]|uniref:uncharacterized protein n=1 Tax=Bacidia gigantensis TaxID=2732470 RepID=UPI001D052A55|nr:uncharacterized protein KY384_006678 [Bacidia gigantensis]KAG8528989.1 hypothetical protein KY384_006678 [Bacidia gigantensis]